MEVDFKVIGLKHLEDLLVNHLPATVARRQLLGSLKYAARPAINLARATAKGVKGGRSGALGMSIGVISSRKGATTHPRLNPKVSADVAIGPLSGQGATPLLAYARYQQFYRTNKKLKVKRGSPIGRIRHGHLVEFDHHVGKARTFVPGTHFLEKAAFNTAAASAARFKRDLQKRTFRAIKKHNAKSPVGKR